MRQDTCLPPTASRLDITVHTSCWSTDGPQRVIQHNGNHNRHPQRQHGQATGCVHTSSDHGAQVHFQAGNVVRLDVFLEHLPLPGLHAGRQCGPLCQVGLHREEGTTCGWQGVHARAPGDQGSWARQAEQSRAMRQPGQLEQALASTVAPSTGVCCSRFRSVSVVGRARICCAAGTVGLAGIVGCWDGTVWAAACVVCDSSDADADACGWAVCSSACAAAAFPCSCGSGPDMPPMGMLCVPAFPAAAFPPSAAAAAACPCGRGAAGCHCDCGAGPGTAPIGLFCVPAIPAGACPPSDAAAACSLDSLPAWPASNSISAASQSVSRAAPEPATPANPLGRRCPWPCRANPWHVGQVRACLQQGRRKKLQ